MNNLCHAALPEKPSMPDHYMKHISNVAQTAGLGGPVAASGAIDSFVSGFNQQRVALQDCIASLFETYRRVYGRDIPRDPEEQKTPTPEPVCSLDRLNYQLSELRSEVDTLRAVAKAFTQL